MKEGFVFLASVCLLFGLSVHFFI
jgi:GPI ethanolamine phosphate transferase 3 subunit O